MTRPRSGETCVPEIAPRDHIAGSQARTYHREFLVCWSSVFLYVRWLSFTAPVTFAVSIRDYQTLMQPLPCLASAGGEHRNSKERARRVQRARISRGYRYE